jgi:hypothetical protein
MLLITSIIVITRISKSIYISSNRLMIEVTAAIKYYYLNYTSCLVLSFVCLFLSVLFDGSYFITGLWALE